ncbi:MAG: metallophosphoesterase family protein [Parasporobacterium sp.]|nr:metallophosphoesterase family protein [Parasporobacterium sp.]
MKVVILSDTHGLLRPEVMDLLSEADAIIHGGDINRLDIMDTLRSFAPLYIVRGNNDKEWAEDIPHNISFTLGGVRFYVVHNKKDIPKELTDADVIVFGHSHKYFREEKDGILWLNPGSCGKRRFDQEITLCVMTIADGKYSVQRVEIPH